MPRKSNIANRQPRLSSPGFTLLDNVLSLFVVTVLLLLFGGIMSTRNVNRTVQFRAQAAALVDEEVNVLKVLGANNLTNQVDGAFKNILFNAGHWSIGNDAANVDLVSSPCPPATTGKHCDSGVLDLALNGGITNRASGVLLWPAEVYSNNATSFQTSFLVKNDSPANWQVGLWFFAKDGSNGYRLRLGSYNGLGGTDLDPGVPGIQNLYLEKIVNGAATKIYSALTTVNLVSNTWYSLKVSVASATPTIKIYLNAQVQDTNTISDAAFTKGSTALLGWNGVHAEFDDVQTVVQAATSTWDFESTAVLPAAWTRLSLNDLPDGTANMFDDNGLLTVSSYPNNNSTSIKKADMTVRWQENGATRSYSTSAIIGNSGIGQ